MNDKTPESTAPTPAEKEPKKSTGKPATKSTAVAASPTVKKSALMYIGPNLPGGKLTSGTLYKGGELPARVKALIEECPALKFLFVSTENLAKSRQALNDASSVLASKHKAVRKHFYKGAN